MGQPASADTMAQRPKQAALSFTPLPDYIIVRAPRAALPQQRALESRPYARLLSEKVQRERKRTVSACYLVRHCL
ncbi:hypothetical protein AAFF_G00098520 [Aldrovandia affinis]|uniref:Uncharacterized protein n=1 Tax=Aldrovandia affinis TaxID=143900 RepID=A0AAD7RV83_9TELE|nr:hypothetical protein AAFF_G00098520 [Aldrovandia affinis]